MLFGVGTQVVVMIQTDIKIVNVNYITIHNILGGEYIELELKNIVSGWYFGIDIPIELGGNIREINESNNYIHLVDITEPEQNQNQS